MAQNPDPDWNGVRFGVDATPMPTADTIKLPKPRYSLKVMPEQ